MITLAATLIVLVLGALLLYAAGLFVLMVSNELDADRERLQEWWRNFIGRFNSARSARDV